MPKPDRLRGIPVHTVIFDDLQGMKKDALFVPDEMHCNACGYEGDQFWYDKNPKMLPRIETPALSVVFDPPTEADLQAGRIDATVSIGSIFDCVGTGEEGASRCMKCNSLDVRELPR